MLSEPLKSRCLKRRSAGRFNYSHEGDAALRRLLITLHVPSRAIFSACATFTGYADVVSGGPASTRGLWTTFLLFWEQFSAQKQGGLAGRPRPSPGVPVRAEPQWVSAESASEAVDDVLEKPMSYSYEYQGENAWPGHESCRITRAPQVPSTK